MGLVGYFADVLRLSVKILGIGRVGLAIQALAPGKHAIGAHVDQARARQVAQPREAMRKGYEVEPGGGLVVPDDVLVQVCLKCGKEYTFTDEQPPADLTCEKCGSSVFRSFFSADPRDEAVADFRDATERDTLTTDPGTDVAPGDLHDLGNV